MSVAALLVLAASAAPLDPGPLQASLARTLTPVEAMGACAESRPPYERRYQQMFTAYLEVSNAAQSLFGPPPATNPEPLPGVGCGERAFARYEASAKAGLRQARQALSSLTGRMAGLWIGTLPVCRDDVLDTGIESLFEDDAFATLNLTLRPALKQRLLAETEWRVGQRMSVRIDGREVMAPNVNEPLSAGAVSLSGPDRPDLERIRIAALRAC